jgi:hypothetical protein
MYFIIIIIIILNYYYFNYKKNNQTVNPFLRNNSYTQNATPTIWMTCKFCQKKKIKKTQQHKWTT